MDTDFLKTFLLLADNRSFTKTATLIDRSQSAVSQQIAKLEHFYGKTLFYRAPELRLTSEGKILYRKAQEILTIFHESYDQIHSPDLAGEIHFGVPEDFASVLLSDLLAEFIQLHPRIRLTVDCDLTLNLYKSFQRGKFDLVLVKLDKKQDFPDGISMWSEELTWIGKHDTPIEMGTEPLPLVLGPKPCVYRKRALAALKRNSIDYQIVFTSPSYAGCIAAVKAGLGVTVYPRNMMPDDDQLASLHDLPGLKKIPVSIFRRKSANPIIKSFSEFLHERAMRFAV
jgi:DNA-binding transcriptional LysR family regulator